MLTRTASSSGMTSWSCPKKALLVHPSPPPHTHTHAHTTYHPPIVRPTRPPVALAQDGADLFRCPRVCPAWPQGILLDRCVVVADVSMLDHLFYGPGSLLQSRATGAVSEQALGPHRCILGSIRIFPGACYDADGRCSCHLLFW